MADDKRAAPPREQPGQSPPAARTGHVTPDEEPSALERGARIFERLTRRP
jgi:hypothetical protein